MQQKIVIISDTINEPCKHYLHDGWKVVSIIPMSDAGYSSMHYAVVLLEKED
jgi:hypothetical protein